MTASTRFWARRGPDYAESMALGTSCNYAPGDEEPIQLRLRPDEDSSRVARKHFTISLSRQDAKTLLMNVQGYLRSLEERDRQEEDKAAKGGEHGVA